MTIWCSPISIGELNARRNGTLLETLGIEFTEIGDDYLRATMPVDARTRQPFGLLHGGASVALAETLGSVGSTLCVDVNEYRCVGQEVNANHVRAARAGSVTGTARPVHLGARTHVWSIEIVDIDKKLVCISRLTVAVLKSLAQAARGGVSSAP